MTGPSTRRTSSTLLLCGASMAMLIGVLLQQPGDLIDIGRMDRSLDAWSLAGRGLSLWDPFTDMGSLQFQTIGYFFVFDIPFALAEAVGVPIWIAQRLMIALLLVVALWGFVRLVERLGIADPVTRVLGGLAFALSPVITARVGWRLPEALGPALLPWVLLPLVAGAHGATPRRSAARSGLALAVVGGINAAVTLALIPAAGLYLLTREPGPHRRSLVRWFAVSVVMATTWWMVPLGIYGAFGPDLLGLTESVATTTQPASLFNALRGSADWLIGLDAGRFVPAASSMVMTPLPIVMIAVTVGAGLAGLCDRRLTERRYFVGLFVVGLMLISGANTRSIDVLGNPFAGLFTGLLEGPLQAFRNVHKFGALVWLPLTVGASQAMSTLLGWLRAHRWPVAAPIIASCLVVALAGGGYPLTAGSLTKGHGFSREPEAWLQAKASLARDSRATRALVVPGQSEATYRWGSTSQTPLQWGSPLPSATRSQLPLGGPDATSFMDAVETAILVGGDPGLPRFLASGGFSHVVVPNDLVGDMQPTPSPEAVAEALERSGLRIENRFGPSGFGFGDRRQIEIWKVPDASLVELMPRTETSILSGDIDSILHLARSSTNAKTYVLTTDADNLSAFDSWVVTDGNARELLDRGLIRSNRSGVLGAQEEFLNDMSLEEFGRARGGPIDQTVLEITGVKTLTASSVGPGPLQFGMPSAQPVNVLDGDPDTAWYPRRFAFGGASQWGTQDPQLSFVFDSTRNLPTLTIGLTYGPLARNRPVELKVRTDQGVRSVIVPPRAKRAVVNPAPGGTRTLEISISRDSMREVGDRIGINEVVIPGLQATVRLRVPNNVDAELAGDGSASLTWVLTRRQASVSPFFDLPMEQDIARIIDVPTMRDSKITATASVARPAELLAHLSGSGQLRVRAKETVSNNGRLAPRNLFDNDPATEWTTGQQVRRFEFTTTNLDVDWDSMRTVDVLQIQKRAEDAMPEQVIVIGGESVRIAEIADDGTAQFEPLQTDRLSMTFIYPAVGRRGPRGLVRLHTIDIPALADLRVAPIRETDIVKIPCNSGLALDVGPTRVAFEARTSLKELLDGVSFAVTPCGAPHVTLPRGTVNLDATRGPLGLSLDQIVVGPPEAKIVETQPPRRLKVLSWRAGERSLTVGAGSESVLAINETFNRGWTAHLDGQKLESLRLDGWKQGFIVPPGGAGEIKLVYAPNGPYRAGLVLGLILLTALIVLALPIGRVRDSRGAAARRVPKPLLYVIASICAVWCTGAGAVLLPVLITAGRNRHLIFRHLALATGVAASIVLIAAKALAPPWQPWWQVGSPTIDVLAALMVLVVIASVVAEVLPSEASR